MAAGALRRLLPELSPALADLLEPEAGPLAAPLRSEIFGPQRFAQHGRSLGLTHRAERPAMRRATFFPRLRDNIRMLRQAQTVIADHVAEGYDRSPASQWLLDNFHLIESQLLAIHDGLPRSYFRALPVLLDEPLAGLPRIYGVAWAFVAHTDGAFDEGLLVDFLAAYQDSRVLRLGEMWALPTTLRVVLVENLRRLAERLATEKAAREVANLVSDRLPEYDVAWLESLRVLLERRGVATPFLAQLAQRLLDDSVQVHADVPDAVRDWLQAALPDLADVHARQGIEQTADNLSVSNAVTSLRIIGDADWSLIIARCSRLMQQMLGAPTFAAEHSSTRDQTLHAIERLTRRSGRTETEVASALLALMAPAADAPAAPAAADPAAPVAIDTRTASHWLRGAGRPTLMRALGLHPLWRTGWLSTAKRAALWLYLSAVVAVTLVLLNWVTPQAFGPAAGVWVWVAALLALIPASQTAVAMIHRLVSELKTPRLLPRLALAAGIPPEHRVMVTVPAMLTDNAGIDRLVHRLQLHWLANPEANAQFALLTDWTDANSEQVAGDDLLLQHAAEGIALLNARYPVVSQAPRFILLHRRRSHSPGEQRWIGWERKRGKLEQLVAALVTGDASVFIDVGPGSAIAAGTIHLLTLDSDTELPPGRLRELVSVAAHPDNRPRLNAKATRVVRGYGMLQPRLVTPLPEADNDTLFHRLFAGQCGIDPYSAASSEVHQDLFGEASFNGKGLLDVHAVHAVLGGRLPLGRVLSHDLLEGALARCAAVSDIVLVEDAPAHAEVAASRVHRWTRGDWQLLPFLLQPRRWPLGAVNRWKLFDNLRRSLLAPTSLALLLLALAGPGTNPGLSPWRALLLVFLAFTIGPLLGALAGLVPSRSAVAKLHFFRQSGIDIARALGGGLWNMAMLMQQTGAALDAISRALWRLTVSHHQLLQWTTASSAQAAARGDFASALRHHAAVPAAALLLLVALLATGTGYAGLALALCLLWGAAPLWSWWASRPIAAPTAATVRAEDRPYLEALARDSWGYFEHCVSAADRHLPPDNLQIAPYDMLARRTSPTNIGLYLLSTACAREFGWIDTPELLARLEATLDSVELLPRDHGHLLNWYDTGTGEPLLPKYVSTVDSGNLSGHLLAVAQACLALAKRPLEPGHDDETVHRLEVMAERCRVEAWRPDFAFLYDGKRHLLHIGWRVAEQQLDASFYDLLASESRLTSLLAIAKGDVPVRHWAALGRPYFAVEAAAALRSWSGSMFEYLMPTLILAEPRGSALAEAGAAALLEQQRFAQLHRVPWGISESAYAGSDHTLAYQYAPQGVPRLALRRTPPDELVVAPYATVLAAQIAPQAACRNLQAMQGQGARGRYGFIEALDFTPARQTDGDTFTRVQTFMAHHQGMSIVALANVLLDGVAQRWGMADPHLEAVTSLLHERAPREISNLYAPPAQLPPAQQARVPALLRELTPGDHAVEPTQLLSNGQYSVSLRATGAGTSRCGGLDIHRWRDDALRDAWGSFLYLRRAKGAPLVSLTQHPAPDAAAHYSSVFHADRVCFEARWSDLQARVTVWVSPEDDIEFRRVELRNAGHEPLTLELISAFEVTLADARADESHPAFSNFFVSAHAQPLQQALRFERRARVGGETSLLAAHFLADAEPAVHAVHALRYQTDRRHWLGRNRHPSAPQAQMNDWPTGGDTGEEVLLETGLDPMCALGVRLHIPPEGRASLTFATAASTHAPTLQAVIDKHRQHSHIERASLMSSTLAGIRLHDLRLAAENLASIQTLTSALVQSLPRPAARAGSAAIPAVCDRRLLWHYGISGDRPLILVAISTTPGLGLMQTLAQALQLWAWGGVACDLVVVNSEPASYLMALQRSLNALRDRHDAEGPAHGNSAKVALHLLRVEDLSGETLATLNSLARIRFVADGRPLAQHVGEWAERLDAARTRRQQGVSVAVPGVAGAGAHPATPTTGRFAPDDGAFAFEVHGARRPLRPWTNVLANDGLGSLITESGAATSWALNSQLNQLTPWSNDPVADTPGEWLLLQELRTREVWSVTASAGGDPDVEYRVVHCPGSTTISHRRGDLEVTARWCVDAKTAVRQVRVEIVNHGTQSASVRLVGIVEWLLGSARGDRRTVQTARHPASFTALLATQREASAGFGGGTAFWAVTGGTNGEGTEDEAAEGGTVDRETVEADWTCDRRECFDASGRFVLPDRFLRQQGGEGEPCAALASRMTLPAGGRGERVFLLGWAASAEAAGVLVEAAASVSANVRQRVALSTWDALLGAVEVHTPDPLFDVLVNRWLLYQTVACRLWAKAGFYQAGGATGFRDQLQDTMALGWTAPEMLREQLLLCASRQFTEGDVQHWWHAPLGAGVRTQFSDDLLWLPYALAHYLDVSGDLAVLDNKVPFLTGQVIPEGAEDSYGIPQISTEQATLYEHAARAIDRSLRVGVHGLPLMGGGDWNDGMNRVGIAGRGESVWLGWFLGKLVADFAPVAQARGDSARAARWEQAAVGWRAALQGPAWDGQWYTRAFFDNGQPLGSHVNAEARIDLIAQAWSVLSGLAPAERQAQALAAVASQLVDEDAGLVRLLTPPFVHSDPSPGYIQAYPPGVRENGGQYSHAGIWALMAQLTWARAQPDPSPGLARAWRWFEYLSPAHRAAEPTQAAAYEIEPYVVAGDVYSAAPYVGRGGWSWYTGAAGWMHRAAIESFFGLQLGADTLRLEPALPPHWPRAELTLRRDGRSVHFLLLRCDATDALAQAGPWRAAQGPALLLPGAELAWRALTGDRCYVVPLLAAGSSATGAGRRRCATVHGDG